MFIVKQGTESTIFHVNWKDKNKRNEHGIIIFDDDCTLLISRHAILPDQHQEQAIDGIDDSCLGTSSN